MTAKILPLLYGTYMGVIDTVMLGLIKAIHLGWFNKSMMIVPTFLYALQPWLFAASMQYESMVVMNLLWDVISDVMVTASGLLFFKEKVSPTKMLGVFLAMIAVVLMASPESQ
jgi:multidrug transporter EmrE-like cation transporter